MIIQNQLPDLLLAMGFTKKAASYIKTIGAATLEINTAKHEIIYPEGIVINERQTCNFSSNENFVVLECVHRLLEKGYKPEHIELEPKWKVGHGASGGRADILVKDNSGRALLIIECKTAGLEFKRAWNKTLQDGDQLFSYAQQISETQFLCLYASDFEAGTLSYQSYLIAHRDNPKYLEENPGFKSFKDTTDVKERFAVWRETYKLDYRTQGLFESNIQPYHVGKDKYTLADLHGIAAADQQKKYHEFATILRQHNVSGRENAFDKLINLFLCKLVDETENPHDLKFYWKGVAFDTHFDLIDRLQQLYQKGMGKFLGETITYIDQSAVKNAMRFIRQNPDATQKAVWKLFLEQKFFTNNDFSLIDVHNEKLFYQNAEILLKILQMWQDIRLTNALGNNQFLGDMFEGFLDQGVKQSEGQYFTPMPICRFIFMSLPLGSMLGEGAVPIKAIDYACGAGHFLNELATQTRPLIAQQWQGDQTAHFKAQHSAIYGIEKEYRLSKVAKVSAFMYGQQDINICYGDGLVQQHAAFPDIKNDSFDLLVANPPYSVRGFLETLPEEERSAYALLKTVDKLESSNTIEAFFIERAQQLLKAGGVAAIILPSSILSNGSGTYIKTREILLQYFDIVAIVELGSGTFGKTGTNTVTLFLRRKKTTPDTAEHYSERVNQWFNVDESQSEYKDAYLVDQYAAHIGVSLDSYKTLLAGNETGAWTMVEYFDVYTTAFNDSAEVKALYKQKYFKVFTELEQAKEINKRYLKYVQRQERDKLYYFVMASDQAHPVLVIKSPSDNKAQKAFLGYDWSTSKGDEGIKLSKNSNGHHMTWLYDESHRNNPDKLNRLIADNFEGKLGLIPDTFGLVASSSRLVDMLDFSRAGFEKQIALVSKKAVLLQSTRYPMEKLSALSVMLRRGKSPKYGDSAIQIIKSGQARGYFEFDFSEKHFVQEGFALDERKLQPGDLLINSTGKGTAGRVTYFDLPGDFVVDSHISIFRPNARLISKFGLYSLARIGFKALESLADGASGQIELTLDTIGNIEIPLPPIDIQQKIVDECENVDNESNSAKIEILAANSKISKYFQQLLNFKIQPLDRVAEKISNSVNPQAELGMAFYIGLENIESGTGQLTGQTATPYNEIKSIKTCFESGDVLYGKLRPNLNKVYLATEPGICSTDILVFRFTDSTQAHFYKRYFLTNIFNAEVLKGVVGQQLPRASWGTMRTIKVPVLVKHDLEACVLRFQKLEQTIAQAQATIAAAPAKKQAIMQKYL